MQGMLEELGEEQEVFHLLQAVQEIHQVQIHLKEIMVVLVMLVVTVQ